MFNRNRRQMRILRLLLGLLVLMACSDVNSPTGYLLITIQPSFALVKVQPVEATDQLEPTQVNEQADRKTLIFHLRPGLYHVAASAKGYQAVQLEERVSAGAEQPCDIVLVAETNEPPVARIHLSTKKGDAPLTTSLDASDSADPDGTIVNYKWDLGDGMSSSQVSLAHTYSAPGQYTVSLEVTDDGGAKGQATTTVHVDASEPIASFSVLPEVGTVPLTVRFDASDSSGGGTSLVDYAWAFGDGGTGKGKIVTHTYTEVGRYDVALTVTTHSGKVATVSQSVEVLAPSYRLEPLTISKNGHTLEQAGKPFFWLGDTAWLLFSATKHDEVTFYFDDAKAKGFTVVQVNLTAAWNGNGRNGENAFAERPFIDNDPTRLNPAYFDYAEWVIDEAAKRGLYVAIPFGEPARTNDDRVVYELSSARQGYDYARALGERFRRQTLDHQIIWLNGQDRSPNRDLGVDVWQALAEGLIDGVNGVDSFDAQANPSTVLMSYHTDGDYTSSDYFHDETWLDFNAVNSWKVYWRLVRKVSGDYKKTPVKPTVCFEASYENQQFPMASDRDTVELRTDWHVRFQGYWCLLSGGAGYTYGHENGYRVTDADDWPAFLKSPGRADMRHLRSTLASHILVPDQALVISDNGGAGESKDYIVAARTVDTSTAFVYTTDGSSFTLDLSKLSEATVSAQWFDPRQGIYRSLGTFPVASSQTFDPPGDKSPGNDWLLVLNAIP